MQVDAIMTLLQKIYIAIGFILFLLGLAGTVGLGVYVYSHCDESCVGLKVLLGFFGTALILISAFIIRSACLICKQHREAHTPLLSEENDVRVYMV